LLKGVFFSLSLSLALKSNLWQETGPFRFDGSCNDYFMSLRHQLGGQMSL
jgi:hypothetical protein